MHVLITNHDLRFRAGSELYTQELAIGLAARGIDVSVYSPRLGDVASGIEAAGIRVVSDLSRIARAPDLIHGHHHIQTMAAITAFPGSPAIFVCHGTGPWQEFPPAHPRIVQYYAVGPLTARHVHRHAGVPPEKVKIVPNWVDTDRFRQKESLRQVPAEALIVHHDRYDTRPIESACHSRGIRLRTFGGRFGTVSDRLDVEFRGSDLVFATGRTALEAMSSGCGVILAGRAGISELILPQNLESFLGKFGTARLRRDWQRPAAIGAQIDAYDAAGVLAVSTAIRTSHAMHAAIDRWVSEYRAVIGGGMRPAAVPIDLGARLRQHAVILRSYAKASRIVAQNREKLDMLVSRIGKRASTLLRG